jgi:hypothetical protein
MKKLIAIICMGLVLSACTPAEVKTVYKDKDVPIYIVPAPPIVQKPVLYLSTMTTAQQDDIGELAKGYKTTLTQVIQYACKLQLIVDKYAMLAASGPTLISPTVAPVIKTFSLTNPLATGSTLAPTVPALVIDTTKACDTQ